MKQIYIAASLFFFSLSALAQLNGTGFYRFRNAQNTSDYISLTNNLFDYQTIIGKACGGGSNLVDTSLGGILGILSGKVTIKEDGLARCVSGARAYLSTDIHMVDDIIDAATVVYAAKRYKENPSNFEYDLSGQSISMTSLTTGQYVTDNITIDFSDLYVSIEKVSNDGPLYIAKIPLTGTVKKVAGIEANIRKTLSTLYFIDDNGTFSVSESSSDANASWYIEPVEFFNVRPEVEFNGKYYTTIYVPFAFTLGNNVEKAYSIAAIGEDGMLSIEPVAENGGKVPAGTPVLLECSSNVASECKLIPEGAPRLDMESDYTEDGTNLLKGAYFCNLDGNVYYDTPSGTNAGSFNANNFITPTNPQKYVIGITESGKLGFVKAEGTAMPANKAWLEYAGTEELWLPFEEEAKPGDVTGDGNVDMADALAIVEIILGQAVEGDEHDYNFKAANVNEDEEGKITIADVVALLSKYILPVSSEETASGPSATFMIDPGI